MPRLLLEYPGRLPGILYLTRSERFLNIQCFYQGKDKYFQYNIILFFTFLEFIRQFILSSHNRNILLPVVFHITAVFFNEIFATHPDSKIIQTVLLLIAASIIIAREKKFFFLKEYVPVK